MTAAQSLTFDVFHHPLEIYQEMLQRLRPALVLV